MTDETTIIPKKPSKTEAFLEFIMTYGWAILVVLAAIGALAYFGVFSNFGVKGNYDPSVHSCTQWECSYKDNETVSSYLTTDFCALKMKTNSQLLPLEKQTCTEFHIMTECEKNPSNSKCTCTQNVTTFQSFSGSFFVNWTRYEQLFPEMDPATVSLKDCFNSKSCIPIEGNSTYEATTKCVNAIEVD